MLFFKGIPISNAEYRSDILVSCNDYRIKHDHHTSLRTTFYLFFLLYLFTTAENLNAIVIDVDTCCEFTLI